MDTEEAALARAVLAAESSERRRQYALETSRRNAAMKQRIKDAQDENGWDEDAAAVCELVSRRELKRDSDVSKQSYIKYKSYLKSSRWVTKFAGSASRTRCKRNRTLRTSYCGFSNLLHAATVKAKRCASSCSSASS